MAADPELANSHFRALLGARNENASSSRFWGVKGKGKRRVGDSREGKGRGRKKTTRKERGKKEEKEKTRKGHPEFCPSRHFRRKARSPKVL